jgi:uncharacterized membrane protein
MKKMYVYLAFASIFFAIVWAIGLLPAMYVLHKTKNLSETDPKKRRDLRGARLLARGGLILNSFMIAVIVWSLISTYVLN